jgi:hypothetical protein
MAKGSLRVEKTRPKGPETGANQPVAAKDLLPLDVDSDFWETRCCSDTEFPGFVRTARPPLRGLFCFWGSASFSNES